MAASFPTRHTRSRTKSSTSKCTPVEYQRPLSSKTFKTRSTLRVIDIPLQPSTACSWLYAVYIYIFLSFHLPSIIRVRDFPPTLSLYTFNVYVFTRHTVKGDYPWMVHTFILWSLSKLFHKWAYDTFHYIAIQSRVPLNVSHRQPITIHQPLHMYYTFMSKHLAIIFIRDWKIIPRANVISLY